MNLVFVLISDGWGGGEAVVHQLLARLKNANYSITLILNHEIKNHFQDLDIDLIDLGSLFNTSALLSMIINPNKVIIAPESKPLKFINLLLMNIYFKRVTKKIVKLLEGKDVSVLHSHLEYSDLMVLSVQKEKKIPWVSNIHGPWFSVFYSGYGFSSIADKIFRSLINRIFENTDNIIFVSKYLQDEAKKEFSNINWDKSLIIHNGVTIPELPTSNLYPVKKGFNILFPGGPKLKKGGDILLESLRKIKHQIPNLNLYIALDVPEDHLIRNLVKKYQLDEQINFVGFLEKDQYLSLLSQMDIMALPSRMEPFGMVYLEAMTMGVPVIASSVGGGVEIVENLRNGIIVDPNPESIAKAILTLHDDPKLRENIRKNNLQDIRKFTWDKIIRDYEKVYQSLK